MGVGDHAAPAGLSELPAVHELAAALQAPTRWRSPRHGERSTSAARRSSPARPRRRTC